MIGLQKLGRRLARFFGPESLAVRTLKVPYVALLNSVGGGAGIEREVNGAVFRVLPAHRNYFTEDYDAHLAAFFKANVKPGSICVNVGANVGVNTLQLARWSAPGGKVYAFEPNPSTAAVLSRHVELNNLSAAVEIVPLAVSASPGKAVFFAAGVNGMSRLGSPNPDVPTPSESIEVEVTSLDEFFLKRGIHPDWMLLDVEGYEAAALEGAAELIRRSEGQLGIVVEIHPQLWTDAGTDNAALAKLIEQLGLQVRALGGQKDPFGEHGHVVLERR